MAAGARVPRRRLPQPARPGGARSTRRRRRGAVRVLLATLLALLVAVGSFVGGLLAAPIDFAVPPAPRTVLVLAADGSQIASIRPPQRREVVASRDIPDVLRHAVISAEDERFLQHGGVDLTAVLRAAYRDLSGAATQGGSTLTQQYVKNVYVRSNDKTALRKVREAALAVRLEHHASKDEILTSYLNVLYLGNGAYGVQAAATYYFGVAVKDLALDERTGRRSPLLALARAAMLAGIAPAPSAWNPVKDFAAARARQVYTLNRMVANGYISPKQAGEAYHEPVRPVRELPPEPRSVAPEFADLVKTRLREQYRGDTGEDALFRSGLRVTTTLDPQLQAALQQAVREVLPDRDDPEAAAAAVDLRTGDVRALTTLRRVPALVDRTGRVVRPAVTGYGRGPGRSEFDLATSAHRSSGSTIKPFTLAVALAQGHDLQETRTAPACDTIRDPGARGGRYHYCNAEPGGGAQSLRSALYRSVNTVYVPLALEVGRAKVKRLMLDAGVDASAPFSTAPASFGLGTTAEVTPLSLAAAYTALVGHGTAVRPRLVTAVRGGAQATDPGRVLPAEGTEVERRRVLAPAVADGVADAMSQVVVRGTATRARQDFPVYAKTGTTNDSTDAWFVGCARSPQDVCIAVWMGYEYRECTMGSGVGRLHVQGWAPGRAGACGGMKALHGVREVYGGTLPARIFDRAFALLAESRGRPAAGG